MNVSNVTEADKAAAKALLHFLAASTRLFDALKLAGMPISGPELQHRETAARWFADIARGMAAASAPTPPMKVKAMGPLPSTSVSKRKRK